MRAIDIMLTFAMLVTPAAAAPGDGSGTAGELQNQAQFCDGTYALCIKAPCVGIPTLDRLGNYDIDHALCSCEVVQGWSMGPGACSDRGPITQHGRTFLISTYSNHFNLTKERGLKNTLTCGTPTLWAWCYGAPCVVDEKDPSKASCTCPLEKSPMSTLGGDCNQASCGGIWSAAVPAGDAFANDHFFGYMRQNNPTVPVNPPALACIAR